VNDKAAGASGWTRLFIVVCGVIGLGLGILVSVTTDIPLAPEIGLVLGLAVGWIARLLTA
jgi:hypothetical protein